MAFQTNVSLPLHLRYQAPTPICSDNTNSDCARVVAVTLEMPSVLARCSCLASGSSAKGLCAGAFEHVKVVNDGGVLTTILVPRGDLAHASFVRAVTQGLAVLGTVALL